MLKGLMGKTYKELLRSLWFAQLEEEEAEGDLIAALKRGSGRTGVDLLSLETSGRIQENRMKLRGSSYVT